MPQRRTSGQAPPGPVESAFPNHCLQLYDSKAQLASTVGRFVAPSLAAGHGALVLARAAHHGPIDAQLTAAGIDVVAMRRRGQYVVHDAEQTLAQLVTPAGFQKRRLDALVADTIGPLRERHPGLCVFGEMVALLWERGQHELAVELERYWDGLAREHDFPLLCAYPMELFGSGTAHFDSVLARHGRVFPGGTCAAIETTDEHRRTLARLQQRAAAFDTETMLRRQNDLQFRQLLALLPVGVYTCAAPSGAITYYNDQAAELWGRHPVSGDDGDLFCGSMRLRQLDGSDLPHERCPMALALRDGVEFRNQEVVIERPDGTGVTVLVNIDPLRDDSGRVTGAVNVFHDITAIRRAEEALARQKQHLQTLLDTLPIAVFLAEDPDCQRITGNEAASRLLRLPKGANLAKTAPPSERPTHFRVLGDGGELPGRDLPVQRAARGEIIEDESIQVIFDDGAVMDLMVTAQPILDDAGRPRGSVACMLDVTELRRAERSLRDTDRRKDEFLAVLAHELRNPLAPIRHSLSLLRLTRHEPGFDPAPLYTVMERQLAQLVRLVDDLLELSRITRGTIELREETVDLATVIMSAIETCRPLIDSRRHHLRVDLPSGTLTLRGDSVRLSQVFANLLNNAARYTEPGGTITLTVGRDGHDAVVSVRDTGIGIAPDLLPRVFEMFTRTHDSLRSSEGLGIGLSLVHTLVTMHGGVVQAVSDGPGTGSEFVVRLPTQASHGADDLSRDGATEPRLHRTRLPSVLVVDDNRDAADSLRMLLELAGAGVQVAYDGRSALDLLRSQQPAVAFVDIGMPGMDGYELARHVRADAELNGVTLVALTGWGSEEDRRRSNDAGFDHHLVKPVEFETVQTLLQSVGPARE